MDLLARLEDLGVPEEDAVSLILAMEGVRRRMAWAAGHPESPDPLQEARRALVNAWDRVIDTMQGRAEVAEIVEAAREQPDTDAMMNHLNGKMPG